MFRFVSLRGPLPLMFSAHMVLCGASRLTDMSNTAQDPRHCHPLPEVGFARLDPDRQPAEAGLGQCVDRGHARPGQQRLGP